MPKVYVIFKWDWNFKLLFDDVNSTQTDCILFKKVWCWWHWHFCFVLMHDPSFLHWRPAEGVKHKYIGKELTISDLRRGRTGLSACWCRHFLRRYFGVVNPRTLPLTFCIVSFLLSDLYFWIWEYTQYYASLSIRMDPKGGNSANFITVSSKFQKCQPISIKFPKL